MMRKNNLQTLVKIINKKGEYGIAFCGNEKVFYKRNGEGFKKELENYNYISNKYITPRLLYVYENKVIYKYEEELESGLLCDYFYGNNTLEIKTDKILSQYKENLKHIERMKEKNLNNTSFYKGRFKNIDKKYRKLLRPIKKSKKLYAFISNGDPTDMNISINGMFCDFENGGYNSIVGEIAICIVSMLLYGAYIYPKYNSQMYIRKKNYDFNITQKNINFLLEYLEMFKISLNTKQLKEVDKYLKYYICFRLLTPISLSRMNDEEKYKIGKIFELFYNTKDFNGIINVIKNGENLWNYFTY